MSLSIRFSIRSILMTLRLLVFGSPPLSAKGKLKIVLGTAEELAEDLVL